MHKLEITGATPEDLFMNAVRMLTVLLKGGAQPTAAPAAEVQQSERVVEPSTTGDGGYHYVAAKSEQYQAPTKNEDEKPKAKRGRPSKADKVVELDTHAEGTPGTLNDDISDLGGKPAETERALTLNDDIRPRLQAIQKACVARGLDMSATVAYILKLYGPFGIVKAEQLKPEQFAEFLEASEGYLSGEA